METVKNAINEVADSATHEEIQQGPLTPSHDTPYFPEERVGWKGYIEWEKAAKVLAQHKFPHPPEFQLEPLPKTNPLLEGEFVKSEKAKDMLHVLDFPYNGEPPRDRLVTNPITPNEDHFVRNHSGIPDIKEEAYFFNVEGLVNEPKRLTLKDLKNEDLFPRQSNTVTIQCSGTRRIEQIHLYPGDGDELINAPWSEGAIGTAKWTGVGLKKIIKHCGGLNPSAKHIEFIGADSYFKKGQVTNFAVSVPWKKVKSNEVLLAWEMNDKPLPKIHGFPLRVVVFGYIGARSCKWLTRIRALSEPSMSPVQRKEYLYFNQQIGKHNATYNSGFSILDMPVSSAIMTPPDRAVIAHSGSIKLTGWAYSGGGRWPQRIEVSPDGGSVWYEAPWEKVSKKYYHAWRTWEIEVPVDAEGWLEFVCRCWDNALNTQPTFVRSAWNWDLHVTSSCHRIFIYSVNKTRPRYGQAKGVPLEPITRPLEFELEDEAEYMAEQEKRGGRDPEE
ncbi:molybdopterin binding oxidoreductase [Choiromyces venosus 120613-1]|uniref:Molybdopterin binding oxidoreductase n=1 Tax=Choiromyces venosus 120613-1 TaxID=1336337 RepID=A0A3N4JAT0_9PEZI|nr:molybdopterin binding oxidoreductase [Choiromyces venosus 120613-1]